MSDIRPETESSRWQDANLSVEMTPSSVEKERISKDQIVSHCEGL